MCSTYTLADPHGPKCQHCPVRMSGISDQANVTFDLQVNSSHLAHIVVVHTEVASTTIQSSTTTLYFHYQLLVMAPTRTRHEPYYMLANCGIPSLVWFEHAIARYGVPTVVFDYWLLVPDIERAAHVLNDAGWTTDANWKALTWNFFGHEKDSYLQYRRLDPPKLTPALEQRLVTMNMPRPAQDDCPTSVMLLPATAWGVNVADLQLNDPFPPLSVLLDGLITSCLDAPPDKGSSLAHLVLMISYLSGYCTAIKSPSFAESLRAENRPFHQHLLEDPNRLLLPSLAKQRQKRSEIRNQAAGLNQETLNQKTAKGT